VTPAARVQVGIRPEWLRLSAKPLPDAAALDVGLVEPLGADVLVHARRESLHLVARMPAEWMEPDRQQVWIDAAASRIDLFDADGRRLGSR
jgi:ABC-type sugar transport system ATPase subunit